MIMDFRVAPLPPASWLHRSCNPPGSHRGSNEHTSPSRTEKRNTQLHLSGETSLVANLFPKVFNHRYVFIQMLHYVYVCVYISIYIYKYLLYIYIAMYIYIYIYTHVCIYIHTHVCIYIYTVYIMLYI